MKKSITMTSILAILAVILSACSLSPAQPTQVSADAINTIAAQTVQALTTQMAPPPATATPTQPPATPTATLAPTLNTTSLPTLSTTGIATLSAATLAPIPTVASSGSLSLFTTGTHLCNQAYFIADANYPDGSKVAPGESFTKKWTLGNDGTCNWTKDYQVVYESGNENYDSDLTGEVDSNLTELVVPGGTTTVGINLVAPKKNGSYTYYFKLMAADGTKFGIGVAGNPFTLVIKVTDSTASDDTDDMTFTSSITNVNPNPVSQGANITISYKYTVANIESGVTLKGTPIFKLEGAKLDCSGSPISISSNGYVDGTATCKIPADFGKGVHLLEAGLSNNNYALTGTSGVSLTVQ